MRGIRDSWQGSRADRADLVLVRPANDLRGRSQLRSAHPAPRQPQLHRRLGNQVSRREGPPPLAVYHLCFACTRNSVLVIPGFDFLYSRKHGWGKMYELHFSFAEGLYSVNPWMILHFTVFKVIKESSQKLFASSHHSPPCGRTSFPRASRPFRSPSPPGRTSQIGPYWTARWTPTHRLGWRGLCLFLPTSGNLRHELDAKAAFHGLA